MGWNGWDTPQGDTLYNQLPNQWSNNAERQQVNVSANDVIEIMENCTVDPAIIDSFIVSAYEVVKKVFRGDKMVSITLRREILKWFAAHLVASVFYKETITEKLGDAELYYINEKGSAQWASALKATRYGQVVLQIDISGRMQASVGLRAAKVHAVKEFSREQKERANNGEWSWYWYF